MPKGFGKFADKEQKSNTDANQTPPENEVKPPPESKSKSKTEPTPPPPKKEPKSDFVFEFKFGSNKNKSGSSGGEQSSGGTNKEQMFTAAMIGTTAIIAITSYYSYKYQEIGWKEFTE